MIYNSYTQPTDENPITIVHGDVRQIIKNIPTESVQCIITSPPYWGVRDYGIQNQIGAEPVLNDYIATLVGIFAEAKRILKPDGLFWLNIANTYTSGGRKWRQEDSKNKGRGMSYRPDTPSFKQVVDTIQQRP